MQTTANRGKARETHPSSTEILMTYTESLDGMERAGVQSSHMKHLSEWLPLISLQCSPSHNYLQNDKGWPRATDEQNTRIDTFSKKLAGMAHSRMYANTGYPGRTSKGLDTISQELVRSQSWRPGTVQGLITQAWWVNPLLLYISYILTDYSFISFLRDENIHY